MNALSPEALAQVLEALASQGSKRKSKKAQSATPRPKLTEEQKAINRAKSDVAAAAAFTAKGYKDVQPRVNVLTYDKWIENGRRVRKGEKSTKVGAFALFHKEQTDAIGTMH